MDLSGLYLDRAVQAQRDRSTGCDDARPRRRAPAASAPAAQAAPASVCITRRCVVCGAHAVQPVSDSVALCRQGYGGCGRESTLAVAAAPGLRVRRARS